MRVTKEQLAQWGAKGLKVIGQQQSTMDRMKPLQEQEMKKLIKKPKMNKTERAYALQLEALKQTGAIMHYGFEEITLVLDDPSEGRKTRYTPDFFVIKSFLPLGGEAHGANAVPYFIEFHEVKGAHIWEDAKMKFKWARKQHPWFRWKMQQYIKGVWNEILLP